MNTPDATPVALDTWLQREAYTFFSGLSDPFYSVTVTADAILFDGYNYLISYTLEKDDGSAFDCTKNPDTGWYHYAPMLLSDYTPELAATHHIAGCSVEAMQTLFDQIVSGT